MSQGHSPYPHMTPVGSPQVAYPARSSGTSKAVPIAVAAGLAVGVFAGLLVIRGTGNAGATTADGADAGAAVATATADAGAARAADAAVAAAGSKDAGTAVAATRADAAPSAVVKPPDAGAAAPAKAMLTVVVEPRAAAKSAKITVDGDKLDGDTHEVALAHGSAKVKVKATARGYRTASRTVRLDADKTVTLRMKKRGSGSRPGGKKPGGKRPGSLIDL